MQSVYHHTLQIRRYIIRHCRLHIIRECRQCINRHWRPRITRKHLSSLCFNFQAFYHRKERPRYLVDEWVGGSGCFGEGLNLFLLMKIEPWFLNQPAHRPFSYTEYRERQSNLQQKEHTPVQTEDEAR